MKRLTPSEQTPEQSHPKRVSVVIVAFNRRGEVRQMLETLGSAHQIVVVDNGSSDNTAGLEADFPDVRFIRAPRNFGLTKALNLGIRASDGEYVLLLHDDVRITDDAVTALADCLEHRQDVNCVCPRLTDSTGAPAKQTRAMPKPGDVQPPFSAAPAGSDTQAECVMGAAMMFRAFFLRAIRQIDERYGSYGSDIELSMQVKKANRKLLVLNDATAIHKRLESPMPKAELEADQAAGIALFLGKHYGLVSGLIYRITTGLGALLTFRFKTLAAVWSDFKIDGNH